MLAICNELDEFLKPSYYIDWQDDNILNTARMLLVPQDEVETVRQTYLFVRDKIKHSWDAQDGRITITAADVLREKVGICWAKSNLLAALLRANNISCRHMLSASDFRRYAGDGLLYSCFKCCIS